MEKKNAWNIYETEDLTKLEEVCAGYKKFLDAGKTERECVAESVRLASEVGYIDLEQAIKEKRSLKAGDKVYSVIMEKAAVFYLLGDEPIENGLNILGAHIDSPRIDVKQVPLYEDEGNVYFDTHYYGGIKKYQWLAIPLAIHGVIVRKDGTKVAVSVGENDDEPVFTISDLLPHLGREREDTSVRKYIDAEKMDLLIGSRPAKDIEKEAAKEALLKILKEQYGIEEEDFLSAELEIVPAGKARECGFDKSMIMAYGQDDRVCAYTSLLALLETEKVTRTACVLIVDKEEIGSMGATGMESMFFENSLAELMECNGTYSELSIRRCLRRSYMISSDVNAAYDPMYATFFEKKNNSFLGGGLVFSKFTGSGGKGGANDANPEYIAALRKMLDDGNVIYQLAELGAVDAGGGGTISHVMAKYAMNVIDAGMAVLSMHAPWEVTSKADIYEGLKGYKVFLQKAGI
ncbi:MAG: aminopeptidase [Lachnospiraceae bacterium]|jgi:aspartyl aminopeptidase|nr:aminopeptidase [Lachnospiraceae bacterium]